MSGDWSTEDLAGQRWAEGAQARSRARRRETQTDAELEDLHHRLARLEAYLGPETMERAMAPMTDTIAHSRAA